MKDDILSAADAAKILGLSSDGVRWLADAGKLPVAMRTIGGMRLFRRHDVEQLAAKRDALKDVRRRRVA